MGMFDNVTYEAPCPICSRPLTGWQSKDAGCSLAHLTPGELWQQSEAERESRRTAYLGSAHSRYYMGCGDCGTWVEIQISSAHLDYTDEDYRKLRAREPFEPQRGPIIPRDENTIPYDWARVACPTCHAQTDTRCRALTSGRTTDAHDRRRQMGNLWRYREHLAAKGYPVDGDV